MILKSNPWETKRKLFWLVCYPCFWQRCMCYCCCSYNTLLFERENKLSPRDSPCRRTRRVPSSKADHPPYPPVPPITLLLVPENGEFWRNKICNRLKSSKVHWKGSGVFCLYRFDSCPSITRSQNPVVCSRWVWIKATWHSVEFHALLPCVSQTCEGVCVCVGNPHPLLLSNSPLVPQPLGFLSHFFADIALSSARSLWVLLRFNCFFLKNSPEKFLSFLLTA